MSLDATTTQHGVTPAQLTASGIAIDNLKTALRNAGADPLYALNSRSGPTNGPVEKNFSLLKTFGTPASTANAQHSSQTIASSTVSTKLSTSASKTSMAPS